jgi:hypothetical protein
LEDEFRLDGDYYKFMAPGTYKAKCIGYRGPVHYRGKKGEEVKKLYLDFKILTEHYRDMELFMALTIGPNGIRPGSKYVKSWIIANDGNPPSRNAIMNPRIFVGKTFTVKVRTVEPKSGDKKMGANSLYSIVDSLVPPDSPDMKEEAIA